MAKKTGLGRGIMALIPEENNQKDIDEKNIDTDQLVFYIKSSRLRPNPDQPRKVFNQEKLEELASSIKEHGVIQPLVVKPEDRGYTIIAGERRWRAATMAGLKELPVIVKDLPADEVLEIAIIENVQRENLNSMEEAKAYQALMETFNMTQGEIGIRIGKSRTAITNTLRLLKLPPHVQEALSNNLLTAGHARAILALEDAKEQIEFADEIMNEKLSVREAERRLKSRQQAPVVKTPKETDPHAREVQEGLQQILNAKVKLKHSGKSGKIEIAYTSMDELDRILSKLGYTSK
ncbi:MAG: ParB family transcriptional regulator, chromosome partitioning protein [Eubacteriaceae bacterium]|nr:ParB family transcriptional regulator, chromosome partitioning protein [Eubacteriaceae bacterium]